MKYKSNTSKKDALPHDLELDKKESPPYWRAKWVNGTLTYPNNKPLTKTGKVNTMTQYKINAQDSETFSLNIDERRSELTNQNWNREKSQKLAQSEGLIFDDEHWAVINYLRNHYLEQGVPRYARSLARDLKKKFSIQGGNKYLRNLFPGGAVTQGCRLANLRTPASATDVSFGTSY